MRILALLFRILMISAVVFSCTVDDKKRHVSKKGDKQYLNDLIQGARNLRELLWQDPHRPKFHHVPPEGFFNDANGALFWHGRYHLFYLARTPISDLEEPGIEKWVAVWDHVSSRDLLHWVHHPPAVSPKTDGSMPLGIYSGGAIKNAPQPTLIYHVPGQGTCISIAQDDELIEWQELQENPVILPHDEGDEFIVFDPAGWYENGKYYALIGNKNRRKGFEGDCTSLFTSSDLINWTYQGPFYKSNREWTLESEDAACPDFYSLGNSETYMLLLHGHQPYRNITHYYLGTYENERFKPEQHGRMSWLGGQLSGPESLKDDQNRNIFFGWIAESRTGGESLWGYNTGVEPGKNDRYAWASAISLPRHMFLAGDGHLGIEPVVELERLRYNHRRRNKIDLIEGEEITLNEMAGDVMELRLEIKPRDSKEIVVKVRCAPDNSEETLIIYNRQSGTLKIDFQNSTLMPDVLYRGFFTNEIPDHKDATEQEGPLKLSRDENLQLRIFIDRSILEVFANGKQCLTQRIYPSLSNSKEVRLLANGGRGEVLLVEAWDMEQTTPW